MRNGHGVYKVSQQYSWYGGATTPPTNCDKLSQLNGGHKFQWYPGRVYKGGRWATEEECKIGRCSNGEEYKFDTAIKRFRPTTPEECAKRASCRGQEWGKCGKCYEQNNWGQTGEKQLCFAKPTGTRATVTRAQVEEGNSVTAGVDGSVVYPYRVGMLPSNDTSKDPLITCPSGTAIKAVAVRDAGGYSLSSKTAVAQASEDYSICWDASATHTSATTCEAKSSDFTTYTFSDIFRDGGGAVCWTPYTASNAHGMSGCQSHFGDAAETPAIWHGRYYRCYDATR